MIPLDGQTYKVKTELNCDQFAHFGVKDDRNPTKKSKYIALWMRPL